MRQINNFEKEILRRILAYNNRGIIPNVASVIDPQLNNKDIYMDFVANIAEIRADMHFYTSGTLIDEVRGLTLEIVTTVNLLKDLQNNGYVTLFLEAPQPPNARYGQLVVGHTFVTATINDPTVTKLLLDYSFKSILIGQPLIDFVNNNFRTDEKVQADNAAIQTNNAAIQSAEDSSINKRNLKIAVGALVISTLLSFWEIYNGTQEVKYGKMQVEQEQNVKLNDDQQKSIENKLQENKKILEDTKQTLLELKQLQTEKAAPKSKKTTDPKK